MRGHDRVFVLLGEGGEHWGEYWLDVYHDIRTDHAIEFYFLCPECGKILFDREEAARKFLEGQPIKEDEIYPKTISPRITPTFYFSKKSSQNYLSLSFPIYVFQAIAEEAVPKAYE